MPMMRVVFVLLAWACAAALALPALLEIESSERALGPLDRRVCSDVIVAKILAASDSAEGRAAGCNDIVAQVFNDQRPKYDKMCDCSKVLDYAVGNIYDNSYDCVIRPGIWNVKETSDKCRETDLARQAGASASTSVISLNATCIDGESCIHGKCVEGVCVCEEGHGGFRWEPIHPLWIGERCAIPWCANDCSGHGQCNVRTGECMCESTFVGDACDVPHHETQVTQGMTAVTASSTDANATFSADDANKNISPQPSLTPSPSPSPSLGSQFIVMPIAPRYTDPCAYMVCGPNGYCDAKATPVQCVCVGGYSGLNCQMPPETTDSPSPSPSPSQSTGLPARVFTQETCIHTTCGAHGRCNPSEALGEPMCLCSHGYTGSRCQIEVPNVIKTNPTAA